jgi:cyclopropane fatty-acyl-phospholipid synthase-like methyltransferase
MPRIAEQTTNSVIYWDRMYAAGGYPTMDPTVMIRYVLAAHHQVGDSALDIGCGQAGLGAALIMAWPGVHYTGWDYSAVALRTCVISRSAASRVTLEQRDWRGGDARRWDTVYACEILEHEEDPAALMEVAGELAIRRLVIGVPRYQSMTPEQTKGEHAWDFTFDELRKLLAPYGHIRTMERAGPHSMIVVVDKAPEAEPCAS